MKWFGEPWPAADFRAPVCEDDTERIPTPVGEPCLWCGEPIADRDRGQMIFGPPALVPAHIECLTRQAFGGPAHLQGTCSCCGGTNDPDLGMTPRQAAIWVWDWLNQQGQP